MMKPKHILVLGLVAALSTACVTQPNRNDAIGYEAYVEANDPLEPLNRYFFELTRFADFIFLKPISQIYITVVPKYPREMLDNFYGNLREPLNLVNNTLQGSFKRAGITLGRVTINTTLGLIGFFDAADYFFGLEEKSEDFGQTFAVYGMPEGPFLFLPFVGPSNFRDVIGTGLGVVGDPVRYITYIPIVNAFRNDVDILLQIRIPVKALEVSSSSRRAIDQIEKESIDFYSTMRGLYRQNRTHAILNGELDIDALPDIPDDELFDDL